MYVRKPYRINFIVIEMNVQYELNSSQKIITVYTNILHHTFLSKMTKMDTLYNYCEFYDQKRTDYAYLCMSDCVSSISRFLSNTLTAYWDENLVLWGSHLNNIDDKFEGI